MVVLGKAYRRKLKTVRYREQTPYGERLNKFVCNLFGKEVAEVGSHRGKL